MRLGTPKTPAPGGGMEPALRLDMLSSDELASQGVSLLPAATPPSVNQGLVLNGTTQYATVPVSYLGNLFSGGAANEITFFVEFFPSTAWPPTEGWYYYLYEIYSAAPASNYAAFFYTSGGVNRLWVSVGATAFTYPANAVIASLWRQNEKNRICLALKSGNNDVYFNGQSIAVANATAWTRVQYGQTAYVGNARVGNVAMLGRLTDVHGYNRKLTNAEAIQLTTVT